MLFYQFKNSQCGDMNAVKLPYFHNGMTYTNKYSGVTESLYWNELHNYTYWNASSIHVMWNNWVFMSGCLNNPGRKGSQQGNAIRSTICDWQSRGGGYLSSVIDSPGVGAT